jgi:hypothetical protein
MYEESLMWTCVVVSERVVGYWEACRGEFACTLKDLSKTV